MHAVWCWYTYFTEYLFDFEFCATMFAGVEVRGAYYCISRLFWCPDLVVALSELNFINVAALGIFQ